MLLSLYGSLPLPKRFPEVGVLRPRVPSPTPDPHLSEWPLPPGSGLARFGVHTDWPWAGESVKAIEEGPARLPGSAAPHPSAQSMVSRKSEPDFKVGNEKHQKRRKKPTTSKSFVQESSRDSKTVLFACPRINCLPSLPFDSCRGGVGCPWALFPLTLEKETKVRAPGSRRLGFLPLPAPEPDPGRASVLPLGRASLGPSSRRGARKALGSSRGRRCRAQAGRCGRKKFSTEGGTARERKVS